MRSNTISKIVNRMWTQGVVSISAWEATLVLKSKGSKLPDMVVSQLRAKAIGGLK